MALGGAVQVLPQRGANPVKRAVRIVVLGPLYLFMALLLTVVYPIWRAAFWAFDDPEPKYVSLRYLWRETVGSLW